MIKGDFIYICLHFIQTFSGGHTLSGACIEPRSLEELFPNWREMGVCTSIYMKKFKSHTRTYIFFHKINNFDFYVFYRVG